jgi:hypothetical protein
MATGYAIWTTSSTPVNLIAPTHELMSFIEKNHLLDDLRLTVNARNFPDAVTDITFPLNEPNKEKLELYKLVYPSSGVTKWGECLVLIAGKDLAEAQGNGGVGDLTFYSDTNTENNSVWAFKDMYLAATIPLMELGVDQGGTGVATYGKINPYYNAAPGGGDPVPDDKYTLHLGLIVDDRYFIANYIGSTLDLQAGCESDWQTFVGNLLMECGITINNGKNNLPTYPTIDPDYGSPSQYSDFQEMGQYSPAVMLEAALINCGLVLVRSIENEYYLMTYNDANGVETGENNYAETLSGGGNWNRNYRRLYTSIMPTECIFHYPVWTEYSSSSSSLYSGEVDLDLFESVQQCKGRWSDEHYGEYQCDNDLHLRSPLNTHTYYTNKVSRTDAFKKSKIIDEGTRPVYGTTRGSKYFRMTARAFGSPPTNVDKLAKLSLVLAADFYSRKWWSLLNESYNGILLPSDSGYFTYIYRFDLNNCSTNVVGNYGNLDVEQFMQEVCEDSSSSSSESSSSESGSSESGSSESSSSESGSSESGSSESSSSESGSSESSSSESSSSESSSSESSSSSSGCFNPFIDLPMITPAYILGMDDKGCLGWVGVTNCSSSSSMMPS